jgi:cobalt-zinc-cadmium efflux system membrane fusion protein
VTATIVVDEAEVPLSVAATALQTYRDWDVVFLNDGSVFQAMPVELGRHDQNRVEITAGLTAGQRYAAENSFIVKADVGKSGASHDH